MGVFQRDDMVPPGLVDAAENGRQGGGFTGAGLAGDQDDAPLEAGKVLHRRGQAQGVQVGDAVRQDTQGGGDMAALPEQVHTDAAACHLKRQVPLAQGGHGGAQQLLGHGLAVLVGERREAPQVLQFTVYPHLGRHAVGDVKVRRLTGGGLFNERFYEHKRPPGSAISRQWSGWCGRLPPRR